MKQTFKVPIRNLFYLLSYANQLPELMESLNEAEDDLITGDFLADQFNKMAEKLIKRGLVRDYITVTEETNRINGRIIFQESLKYMMTKQPQLVVEKDSYSSNILFNQIMKTTLDAILKNQFIDERIRKKSYYLMEYLEEVSTIPLSRGVFLRTHFTRLTSHYKSMVHLAWLIHEFRLMSHKQGSWQLFTVDLTDQDLERLFERFLFGFYQKEQISYRVKSEEMKWALKCNEARLPKMRTDISMEHRMRKEKIIIDAKCYKNIFQSHWGNETFISSNMYQLLAYLVHQPIDYSLRGILIYPQNGPQVYEKYKFTTRDDAWMEMMTINLDDRWENIKETLLKVVQ